MKLTHSPPPVGGDKISVATSRSQTRQSSKGRSREVKTLITSQSPPPMRRAKSTEPNSPRSPKRNSDAGFTLRAPESKRDRGASVGPGERRANERKVRSLSVSGFAHALTVGKKVEFEVKTETLLQYLKQVSVLSQMSTQYLLRLCEIRQTERFEDKDTIIRQGDAPDAFYLILDGAARVLVSPEDASSKSRENEDDAKQLGILVTGDHFGEHVLMNPAPRTHSVQAIGSVTCAVFGFESFQEILAENSKLWATAAKREGVSEKGVKGRTTGGVVGSGSCHVHRTRARTASDASVKGRDEKCPKETFRVRRFKVEADRSDANSMMPKTLQKEVVFVLKQTKLFQSISIKAMEAAARLMRRHNVSKGVVLIEEGEHNLDTMFFIEKGDFQVTYEGRFTMKNEHSIMQRSGTLIGELAVLHDSPAPASVTAKSDGVVWAINRAKFRKAIQTENERELKERMQFLECVPLLKPLDIQARIKLAQVLEVAHFAPGAVVIRQGELGACMYIVLSGLLRAIQRSPNDKERVVATYTAGGYFGELAILLESSGGRRAASIIAKSSVVALRLWKKDAERLLSGGMRDKMRRRTVSYYQASVKAFETKSISKAHKIPGPPKITSSSQPKTAKSWANIGNALGFFKKRGSAMVQQKSGSFSAMNTLQAQDTGYRLSELKIGRVIGKGSYGQVCVVTGRDGERMALKVLSKDLVVKGAHQDRCVRERRLLEAASGHPFIASLLGAYKDSRAIYVLLELCPGGELFSLLQRHRRGLPRSAARFYSGCVVSMLAHLHTRNIVYRDLKPENLLFDSKGYLKLVDFGFAKIVHTHTYTLCGTPEYLAPEILMGVGHNSCADLWSLGCLIFEMLASYPPFYHRNTAAIYSMILTQKPVFPPSGKFTREAKGLIRGLLQKRPIDRLGSAGKHGILQIKRHSYFTGLDFKKLRRKQVPAPGIWNSVGAKHDLEQLKAFDSQGKLDLPDFKPPKDYDSRWEHEFTGLGSVRI